MPVVRLDATPPFSNSSPAAPPAQYQLDPSELRKHVEATYFNLRIGMAVIAFAFPILLAVGAKLLRNISLQDSMSAYYHAGNGAMRDWFVGVLVAIGAFLYLYKGFSRAENYALNLAGIFGIGVAVFPMQWQCEPACDPVSLHGTLAVLFFICIAYVCLFRASDTLALLTDAKKIGRYKAIYRTLGVLMVASPLTAFVVSGVLRRLSALVFFIEAFAVWAFAAYWLAKSREMRETSAERLALEGKAARMKIPRRARPDQAGIVPAN
jgi:hypothetical protein